MKETEIRPGLFITPIPRDEYERNLQSLTGDEKQQYIDQAGSYNEITSDGCVAIFGMIKQLLTLKLWTIYRDFNPKTDFLYVRYDPKPTLFKESSTRSV